MLLFVFSLLSILCAALSFVHILNWLSFVGLVLGICSWVMSRKILQYRKPSHLRITLVMAVVGTALSLIAVIYSFVWGSLMFGGAVLF